MVSFAMQSNVAEQMLAAANPATSVQIDKTYNTRRVRVRLHSEINSQTEVADSQNPPAPFINATPEATHSSPAEGVAAGGGANPTTPFHTVATPPRALPPDTNPSHMEVEGGAGPAHSGSADGADARMNQDDWTGGINTNLDTRW